MRKVKIRMIIKKKFEGIVSLKVQTISNPQNFSFFPSAFSLLPLFLCFLSSALFSQELSNIGKAPLFNLDGGIAANQIWSHSGSSLDQRQPYAYTLAANLNVSIYGWSIPVSGVYSNENWSYQQPFNQFSFSPTYKWVRTQIGFSSMTFSPYTLNGYQYFGGGVELSPPGKWKFSAMAGRMQKRVLPDSAGTVPAYYRFGEAFKTEYSFSVGSLGLSVFHAKDAQNSLAGYDDTLHIAPQQNLALSLNGNIRLIQSFNLSFEYGTSIITDDTRTPKSDQQYTFLPFFPKTLSTHQYHAFKTMVSYNSIIGSIGAGIERVNPGYRTLGTYYMTNDFVNYTLNYSGRALNDLFTLSLSTGLQKDNLDGNKAQETKRLVDNVMIGVAPSKTLNFTVMYSNFSNYTHVRNGFENINTTSPYGNLDTLDFTQISQNMGLTVNYSPTANEKFRQGFNLSANYQKASETQTDNPNNAGSKFINTMGGYNCGLLGVKLTLSANYNYSRSIADSMITVIYGPTFNARKMFFGKKMNVSASFSYNTSEMNGHNQSGVLVTRIGAGYTLFEKHTFDLSAINANRKNIVTHTTSNETTVTFTYRYNFNLRKKEVKNEQSK
jgi:hypothetical protein